MQYDIEYQLAISNNVKIIGGVKIGSKALLEVGSIITKNGPAKVVVLGNPAKIMSYKDSDAFVGSFHLWSKKFVDE